MKRLVAFLLLASACFAQTAKKPNMDARQPGPGFVRGANTVTLEFPKQSWFSIKLYGERTYTLSVSTPNCGRINPVLFHISKLDVWTDEGPEFPNYVVLDVWGYKGTISKEAISKPKNQGVDVTAKQGRTIFLNWGCASV